MNIKFAIPHAKLKKLGAKSDKVFSTKTVIISSFILAVAATIYSLMHGYILAYGDAESHINIAKKVVDDLTPGFAQLGGIWLPLPHLLMVPFVYFDTLWRTGLAGSIVAGASYIVASLYIFKLVLLFTKNKAAAFFAYLVFALNPNILYLQSTPMTEVPLIAFFVLSTYYFCRYMYSRDNIFTLLLAALYGFCAALSRYDGWFLVLIEAAVLLFYFLPYKKQWTKMQGRIILFSTLAFFGIGLWLLWDFLILGDPLYFTNSVYSAKSQQSNWLAKGELPGYHNIIQSFLYYLVTSLSVSGTLLFIAAVIGCIIFLRSRFDRRKVLATIILLVPFVFYWVTLYAGQSVIFIPSLTPSNFEWHLFNVRYGVMMIPFVGIMLGYLFYSNKIFGKVFLSFLLVFQLMLYIIGYSSVLTLQDGTVGLSAAKNVDAQYWLAKHYDKGLLLIDDYARTISIVKSDVPMHSVINVGNKPYYENSFVEPEKYATWIVLQKDDDVWKHLYQDPAARGRLYKYFNKVYTSKEILIFKRIDTTTASTTIVTK